MASGNRVQCRVRYPFLVAGALSVLFITASAAPPSSKPASRNSTKPATTASAADEEIIPELEAALQRLKDSIPPDVREGRAPPSDRERMIGSFLMFLQASTNGLNDDTVRKNREKQMEADKHLEEQLAQLHEQYAKVSPEIRQELDAVERLLRETSHMLDFLNRPATFPSTRESQLDLARRIDQIPVQLDRAEVVSRDLKYHNKRLELLDEMEGLRAKSKAGDADAAKAAKSHLDADAALLAATDEQYRAEVVADKLKRRANTTRTATTRSSTAPADSGKVKQP
jgi:hypothetical protein